MGNLIVCFKKEKKTNETTPLPYNLRCLKRKEMVLKSQSKKVYNVNAHLLKLRCVRISITYIYIYEGFIDSKNKYKLLQILAINFDINS